MGVQYFSPEQVSCFETRNTLDQKNPLCQEDFFCVVTKKRTFNVLRINLELPEHLIYAAV